MPAKKRSQVSGLDLDELHQAVIARTRFLDMALVLRHRETKEWILTAGGRWDTLRNEYTDEEPEHFVFVDLADSQIEFTTWFATWLHAFKRGLPRDTSLALAGGDRRGGKTFDLLLCTIATCLEVPKIGRSALTTWAISCNYQERDELDRTIYDFIPSEWFHHTKAPEFRYTFRCGSELRNVSADNPNTLKRGRVDVAFFNEAQKIQHKALVNGIYGTVDKGGLALLAANPPDRVVGEWVYELKQAIDDKELEGAAKFFGFDSKDNPFIDAEAKGRVGRIIGIIDPAAAKRDGEGLWLPVGERAYENFRKKARPGPDGTILPGLVGEVPQIGFEDVTVEAIRKIGYGRSSGRVFDRVLSGDFQGRPHHVATGWRIYRRKTDGKYVYVLRHEYIAQGTELDLSDEILDGGEYTPENSILVADASGEWQAGKNRRQSNPSWETLQSQRWVCIPPREKIQPESKHAANPRVELSLQQMFVVMREGRFLIHPDCKWAIEAFEKCPVKREGARVIIPATGGYSHITDTGRYLVWRFEPKAKRAGGTPPRGESFPGMRPGAGFGYR
jgi:hypothetical protein